MYESKLGTEKELDTIRITSANLRRSILPKEEGRIIQKKEKKIIFR